MSQNESLVSRQRSRTDESQSEELGEGDVTEESPESEDEGESELPLDVIFELLKNQRRRHLLRYLDERDGKVPLGELAEHVAALENDTTVNALTSGQRKRVYVGLYQCHLPKMDDAGVIDFNRDRGLIELNESAAQLDAYLDEDTETERAWHNYYLGLTVAGGLLYGSSYAVLSPTHVVTTGAVVGLLVAIAACSVAHYYEASREQ